MPGQHWFLLSKRLWLVNIGPCVPGINLNNSYHIYIEECSSQFGCKPYHNPLTHWGRDKMAAISQTTLSNGFSWMKMLEFRLRFHWSLFLRVQITIIQHCFRWWLGAGQATSHYLNQWWLVYWRIYASLGLNDLTTPNSIHRFKFRVSFQVTWQNLFHF